MKDFKGLKGEKGRGRSEGGREQAFQALARGFERLTKVVSRASIGHIGLIILGIENNIVMSSSRPLFWIPSVATVHKKLLSDCKDVSDGM